MGQFTQQPVEVDAETKAYAQALMMQAEAIEAAGGPDVKAAFNSDPEIKQKVLSREWTFADVAKHLAGKAEPTINIPSPQRRPNGGGPAARSVNDLTGEQFSKMQAYLARGGVIDMRQK